MRERAYDASKRAADLMIALVGLVIAAPVLLSFMLWIRLETPGAAIFRQTRVGRNGRRFTILKLRTMIDKAEHLGAGLYNDVNDVRFTRSGIVARKTSIDELPQLLNVLRGEMSVVGPRPMLPVTVDQYADDYATILTVKPGITGLAQVSGRNTLPRSRRLALDKEYVRRRGVFLDIAIMLKTVSVALRGEGQMNTQGRGEVER